MVNPRGSSPARIWEGDAQGEVKVTGKVGDMSSKAHVMGRKRESLEYAGATVSGLRLDARVSKLVSFHSSYLEILTPKVTVLEGGPLRNYY